MTNETQDTAHHGENAQRPPLGWRKEAERLRAALVLVHGYLVEGNPRVARLVAEDQLNTPTDIGGDAPP